MTIGDEGEKDMLCFHIYKIYTFCWWNRKRSNNNGAKNKESEKGERKGANALHFSVGQDQKTHTEWNKSVEYVCLFSLLLCTLFLSDQLYSVVRRGVKFPFFSGIAHFYSSLVEQRERQRKERKRVKSRGKCRRVLWMPLGLLLLPHMQSKISWRVVIRVK